MRNPLSEKVVAIKPSGIRKFFDIAQEMKEAISLGVGEPDFDTPWRKGRLSILPTRALRNSGRRSQITCIGNRESAMRIP